MLTRTHVPGEPCGGRGGEAAGGTGSGARGPGIDSTASVTAQTYATAFQQLDNLTDFSLLAV
ncbi:hypothetical protein ABZ318_22525, partial [Streptomyces sp. NPDC006197]|uniref:hypothetical protein n=1 Tax=Streptomyces sp. NPDC006197 TaxID=3156685 RepID=UPI0033B29086